MRPAQPKELITDVERKPRCLVPLRHAQWQRSRHTQIEEIVFELPVLYGLDHINVHAAMTAVALLNKHELDISAETTTPAFTP